MLDFRYLIRDADKISIALTRRGIEGDFLQRVQYLARHTFELRQQLEMTQARARSVARRAPVIGARVEEAKLERKKLREEHAIAERELISALHNLPNLPHPSAPNGTAESDDVQVAEHLGVGPGVVADIRQTTNEMGFDADAITQIAGAGFKVARGFGARMLRALADFALELHSRDFEELSLPALVSDVSMFSSGHLPKFINAAYSIAGERLWLAPTAEVSFCALHRGRCINAEDLPARYMAHVPCFRREVGGGGGASRFRLHQYYQVELFSVCHPSRSLGELQFMLENAEMALRRLELRYRVVELCCGRLPFSAAKAYKIELFLPHSKRWLDVSTVSLATDFLSRRSNIRVTGSSGRVHVHTLNASALACSRVWLALSEYGYGGDQKTIPAPLTPYF